MDNSPAEKMERRLQDFNSKRENYEREIVLIKEGLKQAIDSLFDKLIRDIDAISSETDEIVVGCIKEFKRLDGRRLELGELRQKLTPVLELLGGSV